MTPFRKYGKHSIGSSTYGPWVRTYSKLFSRKSVLTVCRYRAQSNEICTYGRVSRGSLPRIRRYGPLYLRTVGNDQWLVAYSGTNHHVYWWFLGPHFQINIMLPGLAIPITKINNFESYFYNANFNASETVFSYQDCGVFCCASGKYQEQWQLITSHRYWRM